MPAKFTTSSLHQIFLSSTPTSRTATSCTMHFKMKMLYGFHLKVAFSGKFVFLTQ